MEFEYTKLNGFDEQQLPDILPGTANEIIAVNNDATDYILIPTENIIPEPITYKQVLNSTAGGWDWTTDPKAVSFTADGGANGYKFDGTTSSITTEFNTTKIINNGVERVLCTSNGVELKGGVIFDNLITVPASSTFGIGTSALHKIEFTSTNISLRSNNTIRVQCTGSGVTLVGNITQNTNTSNINTFSGTVTIDSLTTATNFKATNAGTSVLAAVRVVDDNTGLYQSSTGNLDILASGTRLLNCSSTRTQTTNNFEFNRCYSLGNNVIVTSGSASIPTTGLPLYIAKGHATLNQDIDFNAASTYYSGQTFHIITVDVSGTQLIRYRAQSSTTHIQNGVLTTIAANTYHTLEKNRMYNVFCNVDSNTFYLIRI